MGLIVKIYSPQQAARTLKARSPGIERPALRERTAIERLIRQGKLGTVFGRGAAVAEIGRTPAASRPGGITILEMIRISEKLAIMKDEVKIELFREKMKRDDVMGHNADRLKDIIEVLDPEDQEQEAPEQVGCAVSFVNLFDGRLFSKRLSAATGWKFRVQTEPEFEAAKKWLSGDKLTWTETGFRAGENGLKEYVLRQPGSSAREHSYPENRFGTYGLRLVEDI